MTQAELKKVVVVEKILDGRMTNKEGANVLGLSERQIIRLKQKYLIGGPKELAHKNRGRKPVHALPDELKEHVAALYTEKYHGSNHCHFAELLEEHEAIRISPSSVRRILLNQGIKKAKQRRRSSAHQPRERKPQAGMLWQIDATPYAWLEERAPAFTLHAAIDDLDPSINLDHVFTLREYRQLGHGNTLSYNGKVYTFAKSCHFRFEARTTVEVRETLSGEVLVWHDGQAIPLKETEKPTRKSMTKTKKAEPAQPRKPAANHPWRLAWNRNQQQDNTKSTDVQVT